MMALLEIMYYCGNRRELRHFAGQLIPDFAEIYVKHLPKTCKAREASLPGQAVQKYLYKRAVRGKPKGELFGIFVH